MEPAERVRAIAASIFGLPGRHDLSIYGYYLMPDVPAAKLAGAMTSYARFDLMAEEPVLLHDDTVFGSGKRGFLVTTRALHYCLTHPQDGYSDLKGHLPLDAITGLRMVGGSLYVNDEKLGTLTQPPEAAVLALEAFFARLANADDPGAGTPNGPRAVTREAVVATLRELKVLADEGVLTADEFSAKKAELLARL